MKMSNALAKATESTPITKETIHAYLCPNANDQDIVLAINICKSTGMNPFIGDVNFIKYDKSKPMQIVTRKDWFFKTANRQDDYEGMDHGVILLRNNELVYQSGAFIGPKDQLLGGWAEVYRKNKRSHRAEVTLSEYNKGQSIWNTMPATMINKVAKVHALRESYPEVFHGIVDESEMSVIEATHKTVSEKPPIEMPTKKADPINQEPEVFQTGSDEQEETVPGCYKCGNILTPEVKEYSIRFFKIPLCRPCQDLEKKSKTSA